MIVKTGWATQVFQGRLSLSFSPLPMVSWRWPFGEMLSVAYCAVQTYPFVIVSLTGTHKLGSCKARLLWPLQPHCVAPCIYSQIKTQTEIQTDTHVRGRVGNDHNTQHSTAWHVLSGRAPNPP